jgi:phosphoglycerate kinase
MRFRKLREIENIEGKRVILRLGLNVPVTNGKIDNGFRLEKSILSINFLKERGAKIIIVGHIDGDETDSLEVVYEYYKSLFSLKFVRDIFSKEEENTIEEMNNGDVVLLENLRLHEGEKKNNPEFCKKLANYGDIYVNDAFPVSHRKHASIVGITKLLPSYAGIWLEREVEELSFALNPPHPFTFIIGGAKFSTKLPLIESFLDKTDYICAVGALCNPYLSERGISIGASLMPKDDIDISKGVKSDRLILPENVWVANEKGREKRNVSEMKEGDVISDMTDETIETIMNLVKKSKLVVWNGPVGDYERDFSSGTEKLAREIQASGIKTIIGGGDTLAVISPKEMESKNIFVSTGGGAMLDFLLDGTLPGLEALDLP